MFICCVLLLLLDWRDFKRRLQVVHQYQVHYHHQVHYQPSRSRCYQHHQWLQVHQWLVWDPCSHRVHYHHMMHICNNISSIMYCIIRLWLKISYRTAIIIVLPTYQSLIMQQCIAYIPIIIIIIHIINFFFY